MPLTMTDDKKPSLKDPTGVPFRAFCKAHKRPYDKARANMVAATNALAVMYLDNLRRQVERTAPIGGRQAAFDKAIEEAGRIDKPICCQLSADQLDQLLGDMMPTTGDEQQDILAAMEQTPQMTLEAPTLTAEDEAAPCPIHGKKRLPS